MPRDETKAKVGEVEKRVVTLRRQGVKALKQIFGEIVGNEEQTLQQKVTYFSEEANLDSIRAQMDQLLEFWEQRQYTEYTSWLKCHDLIETMNVN